MSHLSPSDLLDALEAPLLDPAARHLTACVQCRGELASLERMLREVRQVDVPAPSPLFWEHFPRRVSAAIEADRAQGPSRAAPWRRWRVPAAAVATAAMVTAAGLLLGPRPSWDTPTHDVPPGRSAETDAVMIDDTPWTLVEALADDLDLDDVGRAGLMIGADTVELAAAQLTAAEHVELLRLLEAEIHR